MNCNRCGKENNDNAVVCSMCGAPLYDQANVNQGYVNPQPYGVNPQPYGVNPQPYGVNPQPYVVNSQPYGANSQPYGANPQVKKLSALSIVGSIFLNFFLFGAIIWLFFAILLKSMFSGKGIQIMLEASDVDMNFLSEALSEYGIDEDEFEGTFDGEAKIVSDTVDSTMNYYLTGKGEPIDVDQWMEFFEDNQEALEDAVGEKMTEEDFDLIRAELEDANGEIMDEYEGAEYQETMEIFGKLVSIWNIVIPLVIILVCVGLNVLVTRPFINAALKGNGTTGLIAGILAMGITGVISILQETVDDEMLEAWLQYMHSVGMTTGVIMIVLSIAAIVAGIVLKKSVTEKVNQI